MREHSAIINSVRNAIRRMLTALDPDPNRPGIIETPERAAKAWAHWTAGYDMKPEDVLKDFADGAEGVDEMVIVKDIPFYSTCEHHLATIFGALSIAYIPDKRIVGLSKLSRVADIFAQRLQVQERMTCQIADALQTHLKPRGVGVVVKARHMCMESRGIAKQGAITVTSALRGVFKEDPTVRAEFLSLTR